MNIYDYKNKSLPLDCMDTINEIYNRVYSDESFGELLAPLSNKDRNRVIRALNMFAYFFPPDINLHVKVEFAKTEHNVVFEWGGVIKDNEH